MFSVAHNFVIMKKCLITNLSSWPGSSILVSSNLLLDELRLLVGGLLHDTLGLAELEDSLLVVGGGLTEPEILNINFNSSIYNFLVYIAFIYNLPESLFHHAIYDILWVHNKSSMLTLHCPPHNLSKVLSTRPLLLSTRF